MGPERKTTATRRSDADTYKKADPSSFIDPAASRIPVSISFAEGQIEVEGGVIG
jgi:hypothetical protein